jgi:glycosyltransferase involved in cell wall biosynthesis
MKILRIIARLNVGGPARHVVWLTEALQNEEFQTSLIAGTVPPGEEDMKYFAEERGVRPHFIPEMSRELSAKDLSSFVKVAREMFRFRPDIVHTHTAKAGTIGRLAAFAYRWMTWRTLIGRPRRVKIVHTFHGHVFHSYYGKAKTKIFLLIERFLARIATDKIIVISGQQFKEIRGFGVGRSSQFEVIPLGLELGELDDAADRELIRRVAGAADDEILVGFVGRLTEIKNVPHLLKVAALYKNAKKTHGPALKFVIIGDGHLRARLEAESSTLGINEILTFAGNRTDVAKLYAGLDVVALTSLNEGTPLSLIEAMASSTPVISTGVGGVIDLLGDVCVGREGFMECERGIRVDSGRAEDLLAGLIFLAGSAEIRERLGRAGREFVHARYGKDRLIGDISELYRRIGTEPPESRRQ